MHMWSFDLNDGRLQCCRRLLKQQKISFLHDHMWALCLVYLIQSYSVSRLFGRCPTRSNCTFLVELGCFQLATYFMDSKLKYNYFFCIFFITFCFCLLTSPRVEHSIKVTIRSAMSSMYADSTTTCRCS